MKNKKKSIIFCDSCQTVMKVAQLEEPTKLVEKVQKIVISNPDIMGKQDGKKTIPALQYEAWSCVCPERLIITLEQTN